jgi:hypothetical protein
MIVKWINGMQSQHCKRINLYSVELGGRGVEWEGVPWSRLEGGTVLLISQARLGDQEKLCSCKGLHKIVDFFRIERVSVSASMMVQLMRR